MINQYISQSKKKNDLLLKLLLLLLNQLDERAHLVVQNVQQVGQELLRVLLPPLHHLERLRLEQNLVKRTLLRVFVTEFLWNSWTFSYVRACTLIEIFLILSLFVHYRQWFDIFIKKCIKPLYMCHVNDRKYSYKR